MCNGKAVHCKKNCWYKQKFKIPGGKQVIGADVLTTQKRREGKKKKKKKHRENMRRAVRTFATTFHEMLEAVARLYTMLLATIHTSLETVVVYVTV